MWFVLLGAVDGIEGVARERKVSVEVRAQNILQQFVRDQLYMS